MKRKRSTETKDTQADEKPSEGPHPYKEYLDLDQVKATLEETTIPHFYKIKFISGDPFNIRDRLARRWKDRASRFPMGSCYEFTINESANVTGKKIRHRDRENPSKYSHFLDIRQTLSKESTCSEEERKNRVTIIINNLKRDGITCDVLLPLLKNKDNTPPLTSSSNSTPDSRIPIKRLLPTLKRSSPLHFNPPPRPRPRLSDSSPQASVSIPSQTTSGNVPSSQAPTSNSSSTNK